MTRPMDNLKVRIAPGADLTADRSTWTWVDITSRVHSPVTVKHGRLSESPQAGPDTFSATVQNDDGALSPDNPLGPWYGDLDEGTPLQAYWDTTANVRFDGNITALPIRWRVPTVTAVSAATASGPLERMQQGAQALSSPLFRSLSTDSRVVAYWPCEDNDGSESAASPIMGVSPWTMPAEFASADGPPGSDRLLRVTTDTASTMARVPNHTPGDVYVVQVAYQIEDESGTRSLLAVHTTSDDVARWQLHITDTTFRVRGWDGDGTLVVDDDDGETLDHTLFGQWVRVELRLSHTGSQTQWFATIYGPDAGQTELNSVTGGLSTSSVGRITRVGVGNGGDWAQDRYFGHMSVMTGTSDELPIPPSQASANALPLDRGEAFHGYTGELAADRFERLCDEQGLTCSIVAPTGGVRLGDTDNVTTPDAAAHDITGDIEVRAWLAADSWEIESVAGACGKWSESDDERSWRLSVDSISHAEGHFGMEFQWSTDGTSGTVSTIDAELVPQPALFGGYAAIRVTLDVNDGASGHVITFSQGPSLDGPWTEFYSDTIAGTTSIHSGTAELAVGENDDSSRFSVEGIIRGLRVYDGIGGTLVADPDFTQQTIGATSFDDDAGNTWTLNGDAAIVRADDSMPMGPQQIDTLVANLQDIVATDGGRLTERAGGFRYRVRSTLHNQDDALTVTPQPHMPVAPEPTRDNQNIRNDITADRPTGSSVHVTDQASIKQRGPVEDTITVNPATDDQLAQIAYWRLHIGTVPGMRWPRLPLRLSPSNTDLIADWLAVRIGDRISVDHAFAQIPGVDVDLLVDGWTESWDAIQWDVQLNCVPACPFTVLELEHDTNGRIDTSGAETSGSFDAGTDTSLTVVTTAERPWINSTDHAAQFPFEIAVSGVVLNVTAISGSTSPQTFTVTQAPVNGVEKTIPTGSAVHIHPIPVLAL